MSKPTYLELLRDPRWQKRRLEIMNRAAFMCEECGDGASALNVHHRIYRKGAAPWEYPDPELICICETCHQAEHLVRDGIASAMAQLSGARLQELLGFAEGLVARDLVFTDEEDQDRDRTYPIRSSMHVRGFAVAVGTSVDPDWIKATVKFDHFEFEDVYALGADGIAK
jgi:hypothetical protein